MEGLYSKPLRVYLLLGALVIWGLISGLSLPVSLFPTSSQPTLSVNVSYGSFTAQQFFETIGQELEPKLQTARAGTVKVENLIAQYNDRSVNYRMRFDWGANAEEARKAVEAITTAFFSSRELAIRRSVSVNNWNENQGFLAISFFSPLRSLDEVYEIVFPLITPMQAKIPDADSVGLFNPSNKEINVQLSPEKMALHQISTSHIEETLRSSVQSLSGGTLHVGEKDLQLNIPKSVLSIEALGLIRVSPINQAPVLLKDIAEISTTVSAEGNQKFKTSGVESLILFARPKEGGNVKRMADGIVDQVDQLSTQLPKDIQHKVLVNPSNFINDSIIGVLREVGLAAFLAVIVLFLFIGSFRNVATAAIEIPISLVMAFIMMKFAGMNLNLISLGGLALSAGMNVDASVVVLENIFRHLQDKPDDLPMTERIKAVIAAVNEVKLPIIASTIASLVVFTPLVFTEGLTNALLGDLAKAVIFSHGLSAVVALILVPTIRLHLMRRGSVAHVKSPIEGWLVRLDRFYRKTLTQFLHSSRAQWITFGSVILALPLLFVFIVPSLPKEVIGRPETDWVIVGLYSPNINTTQLLEAELEKLEIVIFEQFQTEIDYTFMQIQGAQNGHIMMHLKSRKMMEKTFAKAEKIFKNTPLIYYWIEKWNPSELKIPDPPDFRIEIVGGSTIQRFQVAEDVTNLITSNDVFDKVRNEPSVQRSQFITIDPLYQYSAASEVMTRNELSHYLRTATEGLFVENISQDDKVFPIYMRFPSARTASLDELKALPIGFEGRLIPLGAIARFSVQNRAPEIYRENLTSIAAVTGRLNSDNRKKIEEKKLEAQAIVNSVRERMNKNTSISHADMPIIQVTTPNPELQKALRELGIAILISIALVFLVMILQLGDVVQSALVMVSIPLGLIGVILSLYIFGSTLSLNSGLGTILLNGIAVANSIILVDFIQKLFNQGKTAAEATVQASTARLRPILMTSLTTVLGMLPIALGMGEGGKILQPLGIAVCGGLWVSMLMTLYIVPALQYQYLKRKEKVQPLHLNKLEIHNLDFISSSTEQNLEQHP